MTLPSLSALGFGPRIESAFHSIRTKNPGALPARVAIEHRGGYEVITARGAFPATLAGRLRHALDERLAVGDWVLCELHADRAIVVEVLPRTSVLRRGLAGGTTEAQIVCANVDVVFVVTALDRDLNPRRLERYLTAIEASGAAPAIVLTKADASVDRTEALEAVEAIAAPTQTPIHVTSSATGEGLDALRATFGDGATGVLVGSSGVGKSSLVVALGGGERAISGLDATGRGRHTTTRRELVALPTGGVLVDTPGMRELRLFGDESDVDAAFADVEELARACRFRDCTHEREPDCAVRAELDAARYASYHKLRRELAALATRKDARAQAEQRRAIKVRSRAHRERERLRRG